MILDRFGGKRRGGGGGVFLGNFTLWGWVLGGKTGGGGGGGGGGGVWWGGGGVGWVGGGGGGGGTAFLVNLPFCGWFLRGKTEGGGGWLVACSMYIYIHKFGEPLDLFGGGGSRNTEHVLLPNRRQSDVSELLPP